MDIAFSERIARRITLIIVICTIIGIIYFLFSAKNGDNEIVLEDTIKQCGMEPRITNKYLERKTD